MSVSGIVYLRKLFPGPNFLKRKRSSVFFLNHISPKPFGRALGTSCLCVNQSCAETLESYALMILHEYTLLMSTSAFLISSIKLPLFYTIYKRFCYQSSLPRSWLFYRSVDFLFSVKFLSLLTFSTQISSTSELLRYLWRMAASKPTSWLSSLIHFLSHSKFAWRPYKRIWAVSLLAKHLSMLSLSASHQKSKGFEVSMGSVKLWATLTRRVLYTLLFLTHALLT